MSDAVLFPAFPDWQACYELYLQSVYDKSGSIESMKSARSSLCLFFADRERNPATCVRADVLRFLSQPSCSVRNRGKPLAANSRNVRVSVIRGFYKFCSEYDLVLPDGSLQPLFRGRNPCQGIPYYARNRHVRGMSAEEVDRVFAVIDDSPRGIRDRAIFTLLLLCGKRRAELLTLRWGDISEGDVTDKDGTTRRTYVFQYRRKGHQREVSQAELPGEAYRAIVRYLRASGRYDSMTPQSPLFMQMRPGSGRRVRKDHEPLGMNSVAMIFRGYLVQCGLADKGYGLHAWRHASLSIRYLLGSDIKAIQTQADHASLLTTSRYLESISITGDEGARLLEKRFAYLALH